MLIFGEGFGFFSPLNLVNSAVLKCFSLNSRTNLFMMSTSKETSIHFKNYVEIVFLETAQEIPLYGEWISLISHSLFFLLTSSAKKCTL